MIFESKFDPPVKAEQIQMALDGSYAMIWSPMDADGLCCYQRYDREGDKMILKSSATYRLEADGKTWTKQGESEFHS